MNIYHHVFEAKKNVKIWRCKTIPFYDIPVKVYENLYFEEKTADKKHATLRSMATLYCKKRTYHSIINFVQFGSQIMLIVHE